MPLALTVLRGWGTTEDAFDVLGASETEDGWDAHLALRPSATDAASMSVHLHQPATSARITLSAQVEAPTADADVLRRILLEVEETRWGIVSCVPDGSSISVRAVIFADGFSRHTLNATLLEMGRASGMIARRASGLETVDAAPAPDTKAPGPEPDAPRHSEGGPTPEPEPEVQRTPPAPKPEPEVPRTPAAPEPESELPRTPAAPEAEVPRTPAPPWLQRKPEVQRTPAAPDAEPPAPPEPEGQRAPAAPSPTPDPASPKARPVFGHAPPASIPTIMPSAPPVFKGARGTPTVSGADLPDLMARLPASASPVGCTTCGTLLPAGAHFCKHCGTPVMQMPTPSGQVCPNPGCRTPLPITAVFCTSCGTRLRQGT